jgi:geranylgeranyl reductase family protein
MEKFDVVVVGAGPAGSTAARILATAGARVALYDRAAFPRDKPCGGGVTFRAGRLLPAGFEVVCEQTVYEARFSFKHRPHSSYRANEPLTYMTQRSRLDQFLAEAAAGSGAVFRDGEKVSSIEQNDGVLVIQTTRDRVAAGVVIGADGANGATARLSGLAPRDTAWIALEGNADDPGRVSEWFDAVGIDLGSVPGGYGWLFAKGDHVNVGVGGWESIASDLRGHLDKTCRAYGVRVDRLCNLKGHALPIRRPGSALVRGRVLLAGDAAGLVDPLSGEGIHSALLSGRLAAESSLAFIERGETLEAYQDAIETELGADLAFSRRLQRLLQWTPGIYLGILRRSPRVWNKLVKLARGESSYEATRKKARILGPIVSAMAGVAPDH